MPGSRIIAESLDVYRTDDPVDLAYLESNRQKGRMSGQIRMRCRYKTLATPWFDFLMVAKDEMEEIVSSDWLEDPAVLRFRRPEAKLYRDHGPRGVIHSPRSEHGVSAITSPAKTASRNGASAKPRRLRRPLRAR